MQRKGQEAHPFPLLLLLLSVSAGSAQAQEGAQLFAEKHCAVCHAIGIDPMESIGPHLNAVIGRKVGGLDEYANYSDTLLQAAAEEMVWTRELLLRYLKSPSHLFPGTSMAYAGMTSRAEIEALIDYLATFDEEGRVLE